MIEAWHGTENPANVGKVIAINTCLPCFLAAICFYRAGIFYEKRLFEKIVLLRTKSVDDLIAEAERLAREANDVTAA